VVWGHLLNLANPDDKALREGKTYNSAFAVHDDNVTSRGHYISFPVAVGFGAKAAIEATKLRSLDGAQGGVRRSRVIAFTKPVAVYSSRAFACCKR